MYYVSQAIAMHYASDSIIIRKTHMFWKSLQEEQDLAAKESSYINQAYRTLKDPLKRSLYLLKLSGHPLEDGVVSNFIAVYIGPCIAVTSKVYCLAINYCSCFVLLCNKLRCRRCWWFRFQMKYLWCKCFLLSFTDWEWSWVPHGNNGIEWEAGWNAFTWWYCSNKTQQQSNAGWPSEVCMDKFQF